MCRYKPKPSFIDHSSKCGAVLHNSMLLEGSDGTQAVFQGFSHDFFSADLLKRQSKRLCFHFSRDNDDAVDITEENVSRPNRHAADFNWNPEVVNLVAGSGILTIRPEAKGGIFHGQDLSSIPDKTVQNRSPRTPLASTNTHQF